VPLADVIGFKRPRAPKELTPEEKIAELNRVIDRIVHSMLIAVQAIRSLDEIRQGSNRD
jgi:hypothetical protein